MDCWNNHKKHPEFNACLLQFWKDKNNEFINGIPELKIPPLDPMTIDNIQFNEKASVVQVTATFSKVVVKGLRGLVPKSVNVDPATKTIKLALSIPALYVTGTYNIDGVILLLPVKGNGPFTLNLTNIEGEGVCHLSREGDKVKLGALKITFKIGTIRVRLDSLVGEPSVGEAINNMLNDNSQQIFDDIKPKIEQQLGERILDIVRDGFVNLPQEATGA